MYLIIIMDMISINSVKYSFEIDHGENSFYDFYKVDKSKIFNIKSNKVR